MFMQKRGVYFEFRWGEIEKESITRPSGQEFRSKKLHSAPLILKIKSVFEFVQTQITLITLLFLWIDKIESRAHPLKVFQGNFIYDVFVWSNFVLWFAFASKAVPVKARTDTTEHEPGDDAAEKNNKQTVEPSL